MPGRPSWPGACCTSSGGVVHLLAHGIAGVGGGSLASSVSAAAAAAFHIGVVGRDLLLERSVAGLGCN